VPTRKLPDPGPLGYMAGCADPHLQEYQEHTCGSVLDGVAKSTLTHHWRVLRDAGVIWQRPHGRENLLSLRREDLDVRFPGLLDSLLTATRALD
jgi:DNA-binding transcriptional ArsR family regulator